MSGAELSRIEPLSVRYRPALVRYFRRRIRDHAEVEDLVQQVFARLLIRAGEASLEHPRAYLFETASSVLTDHLRRRAVRRGDRHESFDGSLHGGEDFSPERVLIARESLSRATLALLELPERARVVFILRRLEGLRYGDIALRLGISVSAVEKNMQRALRHLAEHLE